MNVFKGNHAFQEFKDDHKFQRRLPKFLNLIDDECRWHLRSVPLGLYTLYPWTGIVVPGQFLELKDS